jgi:hypothetical protein
VSDIKTAMVDSLKVLDPRRPIREADIQQRAGQGSERPLTNQRPRQARCGSLKYFRKLKSSAGITSLHLL